MGEVDSKPMPKTTTRFSGNCNSCRAPLDTKMYKMNIEGYEINSRGDVAAESYRDKVAELVLCYSCKISAVYMMQGKNEYGTNDR